MASGIATRRKSSMIAVPVSEDEFFAPRHTSGHRKQSLALIASRQVLVTYLWGSLEFKDDDIEREWREYARVTYWRRVAPALRSVIKLQVVAVTIMAGVTVYRQLSSAGAYGAVAPYQQHMRDDALRWVVALAVHLLLCVGIAIGFHGPPPPLPQLPISSSHAPIAGPTEAHAATDAASSLRARVAHSVLASWFALWLGTLAYLNVATKFSRADAADASTHVHVAELLEHARASNNSTALIALVSLSCFMRGLKLSYEQCAALGSVLLATTLVAWCVQPAATPLDQQPAATWTNLTWVVLAMMCDIALVRAGEKVRRRLFHLQRAMQTSNTHLMRENQMLMQGRDGSSAHDDDFCLDLESPVEKVLNMLRQMQMDASLLEWQAVIDAAIHKLSRAKLHDLFLPSAVRLPSAKNQKLGNGPDHYETEMVEQILFEAEHHNDQDELNMAPPDTEPHKLEDGVLVEERRKQIVEQCTKSRLGQEASKVRIALMAAGRMRGNSPEPLSSAANTPLPSSPPKAARAHVTDARDLAHSLAVAVVDVTSDSANGVWRGGSASEAESAINGSSPGMVRSMVDKRLAMLEEAMPSWGCGETSIFGLHEEFGPDLLFFMLEHAFRSFNLFEHFTIDALKLQQLASAIVAGYNDHPYHNYIHGCDVTHGTYWMLRQRLSMSCVSNGHNRRSKYQPDQQLVYQSIPEYAILAGLLGAAVHDIGHDGFNNAFHVATGSALALQYNDKSCLENMHASLGLALLRESTLDVLENMSIDQRKKFRTLVIDMIMGTDLANHFEQLSQMGTKTAEGSEGLQLCGEKSDLALFMGNVVHAADLGSTANPPAVYYEWMQRVFREFFYQGEQERALGLPVTPFMDRPTASIPKAQLGFLKYLCQPLFAAIVVVIPDLSVATDNMTSNVAMLTELDEQKFGTEQIMTAGGLHDLLPSYPALSAQRKLQPTEC